jgi:hypothetical protein
MGAFMASQSVHPVHYSAQRKAQIVGVDSEAQSTKSSDCDVATNLLFAKTRTPAQMVDILLCTPKSTSCHCAYAFFGPREVSVYHFRTALQKPCLD